MTDLQNEEMTLRMKSRALWIQERNKNTSFFHTREKARQYRNIVEEIKSQSGTLITSFEEIKKASSSHFGNIYTEE
jgi:hypothetical protein